MLSIIYGYEMGTPESIAWLLCEEQNVGPQVFDFNVNVNNNKGTLFNKLISDDRQSKYFNDHNICMQRMENLKGTSVDFINHYKKYEKDFEHVVWGNHFGRTHNRVSRIEGADKVVFCHVSFLENFTHYITGYALGNISDHNHIDVASEIWYKDHHYLDGNDTTLWRDYWYRLYHNNMHKAYDQGELKYMWQLNFMHWDLCNALLDSKGDPEKIKLNPYDNLDRIWDERIAQYSDDEILKQYNFANTDKLLIRSKDWLDDIDEVLDYLTIDKTENMQYNINKYKDLINQKRDWVQKTFAHKI